jgi:hypothetical protein
MNQIIKHSGDTYRYVDGGIIEGYVKQVVDPIPDGIPWVRWKGAKIPHSLWVQILAFFRWTFESTKPSSDEALVRIYYNERTERWAAWAPPQRGVSMTVKTVTDHPNWKQEEELAGFQLLGTGHHHCSGSAFQSGTDRSDEELCNGLHFTVGHLDKDKLSLHARVVFNRNMQETNLQDWVDMDEKYKALNLPDELLPHAYACSLTSNPKPTVEFPAQWKDNFLKWSSTSFHQGGTGNGHTSYGHGYGEGYWTDTPNGGRMWVDHGKKNNQCHNPNGVGFTGAGQGTGTATLTPVQRGEIAVEKMLSQGMPMIELCLISRSMNSSKKEQWPSPGRDKNFDAVRDMLHSLGLNPRWLEKHMVDLVNDKQLEAWAQSQNEGWPT